MQYSPEQDAAFQRYVSGQNVFVTGPGGSGKSELIRRIYAHATDHGRRIHVTALTGCAAILLRCKAKTLHSWGGIQLGNLPVDKTLAAIKKNHPANKAWKETDVLVVDEVSMLSLKVFDLLFTLGQVIRGDLRPFGGIQLVFSGDFFQLPPVGNKEDPDTLRYCFESLHWHATFPPTTNQILLSKIFRQDNLFFTNLLNQVREGRIKRSSDDYLRSQVGRTVDPNLLVQPTKLFPLRKQVDEVNQREMARLEAEAHVFTAEPKFLVESKSGGSGSKSSNNSSNGSSGQKHFLSVEEVVRDPERRRKFGAMTELEVRQEATYLLNNLACEKELTLKVGAQVMCLINVKDELTGEIKLCNGSQGIVQRFCTLSGMPVVQFNNGHTATMFRHGWESERVKGLVILQVPLILCWAMTIHKSQGVSLDAAEIDIGNNVFECGQSYVALSRVRSLEGLYLTSYDVRKIKVFRHVQQYYQLLEAQQQQHAHQQQQVPKPPSIKLPETVMATPPSAFALVETENANATSETNDDEMNSMAISTPSTTCSDPEEEEH